MPWRLFRYPWTPNEEQPAEKTLSNSGVTIPNSSGVSHLETLRPELNYLPSFLNTPSEYLKGS